MDPAFRVIPDAANGCGDVAPIEPAFGSTRRLSRSRSMEHLSREQLKNTETTTVRIFLEYVRNKLDKSTPKAAQLEEHIKNEQRHRESRLQGCEGRRKRESLRRLQSEPNGPKASELSKCERTSAPKVVEISHCEDNSPRPTRLVLDRPPSNKTERKRRISATRKTSQSDSPSERRSSGRDSSATTPVPVPIPDPPISPCDVVECSTEFSSSYPPPSAHRPRAVSSQVIVVPPVIAGTPISQDHYCTAQRPEV